ncbi:MAG: hypothetical protein V3W41_13870 [Planctomycetota bacterium]
MTTSIRSLFQYMVPSLAGLALIVFIFSCGHARIGAPPETADSFTGSDVFDDGMRRVSAGDLTADYEARNSGCIACHEGSDDPHIQRDDSGEIIGGSRQMGCVDCHGGNGAATDKETAHPKPRFPKRWPTAGNPERTYGLLNTEEWDWIRFVNPGDLRVASTTCGACHAEYVLNVSKGVMTTASHFFGVAAYANGIVSIKRSVFGESYAADGTTRKVNQLVRDADTDEWRAPTQEEIERHGWAPVLLPLPHWEITQVGNIYRVFEQGSRLGGPGLAFNGLPVPLVGIPDKLEDAGRPNNKFSDRGLGTLNRIDLPILNVHKSRLNDPHLSFLGTNDNPGDYRSSGCTACHVVYANDRSPVHSGPYARHGNDGQTRGDNPDPTIDKREKGHPLRHEFTSAIPSSQCMVCHMHQPNSFVNSYYGFQMWTYETDGDDMWPKEQQYPTHKELFERFDRNPEEAAARGKWGDPDFLRDVAFRMNPKMKHTQFADYHGHGWMFRAVFKMDRKGNLLDKDGNVIPYDDPDKFKGVIPLKGTQDEFFREAVGNARRAVHLKDIHAEKGMHCVDCHVSNGVHGDGNTHAEYQAAVQVRCQDCHGTVTEYAELTTSGPVAEAAIAFGKDPQSLLSIETPFGDPMFEVETENGVPVYYQNSMVEKGKRWPVPQVRDSVDPTSPKYNKEATYAKTIRKDNSTWGGDPDEIDAMTLAHGGLEKGSTGGMECYTCHTSWVTACFGCHLPQRANMKTPMHHYEEKNLRNYATYNPQVARDDAFLLGVSGDVKHNRITPVRSSSAVLISSQDALRRKIYGQLPTMASNGMSSQIFNTHFPHTVRTTETRACDDCHLSDKDDNNAWLAQVFLLGTNYVNFVGHNAFVGTGADGFHAIRVSEWLEPQAVIGSELHRMAYPDDYKKHLDRGRQLDHDNHHGRSPVLELQLRGEYLYTAAGPGGFRVYDVANVNNKDFSQKIITAPVSPLGQDTHVALPYATSFVLPINNPTNMDRLYRPENKETAYEYKGKKQNLHETYRYCYVTDRQEGLVVIDVNPLTDGDPMNNFLEKLLSFNPDGILNGAECIAFAGQTLYIGCDTGLVAVDISDPRAPRVISKVTTIRKPEAVQVQFRYAFVADADGLKVVDITAPQQMKLLSAATLKIPQARDIYVARTWGYVSSGTKGLVIVNLENPTKPTVDQVWNANGQINDLWQVKVGMTNDSVYAYLADGHNGLRVASLVTPKDGGRSAYGFAPRPKPRLVSQFKTKGRAFAISKGLDRDRAVDESGNQMTAFGRIGGRPMNLKEMRRLYMKNGKIWKVSNKPRTRALHDR